jgi:hypothetical protein
LLPQELRAREIGRTNYLLPGGFEGFWTYQ